MHESSESLGEARADGSACRCASESTKSPTDDPPLLYRVKAFTEVLTLDVHHIYATEAEAAQIFTPDERVDKLGILDPPL